MANPQTNRQIAIRSRLNSSLAMPLSEGWCALGWCAATALFVGIIALFGGPSTTDMPESVYGTWAVAHGQMACAYPLVTYMRYPVIAPVYLLLSGGIAAYHSRWAHRCLPLVCHIRPRVRQGFHCHEPVVGPCGCLGSD